MNLASNLLREAIKRDSMTPQYRWVVKAQFTSHTFRLGLQGMLYYTFLWCFSLMATTSFPRMSFPYLNLVSPMCSIDIGNVCQLINFHTDLKCSVHNVNLKWHPLVFKWESVWFVWNIMSRSSQLVVNTCTSPNDFMLHKRIITWGLHNFSCYVLCCFVLFCLGFFFGGGGGFGDFPPPRELFPHMEKSPLPVKGCKFLYTIIFQTARHFGSAVWKFHTTII